MAIRPTSPRRNLDVAGLARVRRGCPCSPEVSPTLETRPQNRAELMQLVIRRPERNNSHSTRHGTSSVLRCAGLGTRKMAPSYNPGELRNSGVVARRMGASFYPAERTEDRDCRNGVARAVTIALWKTKAKVKPDCPLFGCRTF